ncbi:hypothetical protein WISP_102391 [Willisornis vidua]|uniref:Rna-directed dna polymerase from mobile element jockey-like n=1 Tax=Willisornis vidua TaxID=1566151 RepID=A0ABQ9D0Z1_9PASS|nr:hypothetical protein WISP_102391 [Willisornis vidua]
MCILSICKAKQIHVDWIILIHSRVDMLAKAHCKTHRSLMDGNGPTDKGIECKFADDTKMSGGVDTPEGQDAIKRDLETLQKWIYGNLMRFNQKKCKMLHLGWGNPQHQYRLGDKQMKSTPVKKDLEVMVDERTDMSWQCAFAAQKANSFLGCSERTVPSRLSEVTLPLYSTFMRPCQEYCSELWGPQYRKNIVLLE